MRGGDDSLLVGLATVFEEHGVPLVSPLAVRPALALAEGVLAGSGGESSRRAVAEAAEAARAIGGSTSDRPPSRSAGALWRSRTRAGPTSSCAAYPRLREGGRIPACGRRPGQVHEATAGSAPRCAGRSVRDTAEAARRAGLGRGRCRGRTHHCRRTSPKRSPRSGRPDLFLLGLPPPSARSLAERRASRRDRRRRGVRRSSSASASDRRRSAAAGRTSASSALAGERMQARGMTSSFPISDVAVMGLASVVAHLPRIVRRVHQTVAAVLAADPDILVIIDSPDFTHPVARRVARERPDLPIVDYVSPSVWAWRPGRAREDGALHRSCTGAAALRAGRLTRALAGRRAHMSVIRFWSVSTSSGRRPANARRSATGLCSSSFLAAARRKYPA